VRDIRATSPDPRVLRPNLGLDLELLAVIKARVDRYVAGDVSTDDV
jgi:hypothetical protein